MRICLICEGSYPYVSGGVAGWVQMLCQSLTDIEFIICSIATTKAEMSEWKYQLPDNIRRVETIYLGEEPFYAASGYKKIRMDPQEIAALRSLIGNKKTEIMWEVLVAFLAEHKAELIDILMGEHFYDICLEEYHALGSGDQFADFLWNFRSMYFPLLRVLAAEMPEADIYHSLSTGYAGILGSLASGVTKKPFILSEHGIYTREREEDIIRADWLQGVFKELWIDFFKKLSAVAYHQAQVVTSLFERNKILQIELGCPQEKIRIIPNGVTMEEFMNLESKNKLDPSKVNIASVLRVVPIKDVKTMLLAFAHAQEQIPDLRLTILGGYDEDPDYYQECISMLHALNIEHVEFVGRVNIKDYLPDIDLLLLSSISEGQPLAVLEGLAAGIPFVCTDVGDCRTLLEGNEDDHCGSAGCVVPVMDSKALAEAIVWLVKHPLKLKEMGENGRKRIRAYYQKESFLRKYRELYCTLKGITLWPE